jgi:hypothetical protein
MEIDTFVQIIRDEYNKNKINTLSNETIQKIKNIVTTDNNLFETLYNLDEIDYQLNDISSWYKLDLYNLLFSEELYKNVLESLQEEVLINDKYFKFLIFGGLICETIKIAYYKSFIKNIYNEEISKVEKACEETFNNEINKLIIFIQTLYDDAKKYFQNDEIFNEIQEFVKINNLPINL